MNWQFPFRSRARLVSPGPLTTRPAAHRPMTAAVWAAMFLLALASGATAQQIVALVDGEPVTALDVEQRSKFIKMSTNKEPVRQQVLDSLIDEILQVREAHRFTIDVPDAEVDRAFANVAVHMGLDAQKLSDVLAHGGASADTLKHRLRAELAWSNLVRGRYKASLEIADTDVEAQLQLHKPGEAKAVGYEYIMRPVVFVVPRGSPDAAYEARKREAEALRARFQSCNDGLAFARALREVAVREPLTKFSADLPQVLRDILDKTDVGRLTAPDQTAEGIQMFALCAKKETTADTPGKREVRDEIFQKKFGAKAKRYLAELRRAAMIEYK